MHQELASPSAQTLPKPEAGFRDYDPNQRFMGTDSIRLFVSPTQYIQAPGALQQLGDFLADLLGAGTRIGVLITPGRRKALMENVSESVDRAGLRLTEVIFEGESSRSEIERVTALFRNASVELVVGIGGGKCLDTARMAAHRLGTRVVTVPTTASTDAPTAAVSVIYREDGVFETVEFSRTNPLLVLADETILAAAPPRYLAAGMGDAYSTYFEARCCMDNPLARTGRGARPTQAALAIARQCRELLLNQGLTALEEVRGGSPGPAFRHIVEANILLSGLGFESGGLAAAHAVAQGLTVCTELHRNFLHGELVAVGVVAHLLLEEHLEEAREAKAFLHSVGLPTHLGDLGFDPSLRPQAFQKIVEACLQVPFIQSEPMVVTAEQLEQALLRAMEPFSVSDQG